MLFFSITIILLLIKSFSTIKNLAKGCADQDPRVLNLQLTMTVIMFFTLIVLVGGNGFVTWWFDSKHEKNKWYSIITIIANLLISSCMWIGLYTFNLFATKPFIEVNNKSKS